MTRRDVFTEWAAIERAQGGRVGARSPADEPLRFVPSTSLAFPASDAEPSVEPGVWVTRFFGLVGASSDLPSYFAEEIADEDPERAVRLALLTPFHHRAMALLFRSVHRCRIPEVTRSLEDVWPTRLATLASGTANHLPLLQLVALTIAPLLHGPRSASSLARALDLVSAHWLDGVPIVVEMRSGGRVAIDPSQRPRLGRTRLGDDALLGGTILDPSRRATVRVGPVDASDVSNFATGRDAHRVLASVVRWFCDVAVEVDVLVVSQDTALTLGTARLGASALGRSDRATRQHRIELHATRSDADREALTNDDSTPSSMELSHATRPSPARPQAHAHGTPSSRERRDERRPLAAR